LEIATGKLAGSPFTPFEVADLRTSWFSLLPDPARASTIADFQPFYLSACGQTLQILGDPDWRILEEAKHSYSTGVPVGIGPKGMPRVPAVFRRKVSWRKLDPSVRNLDASNYSSAKDAYNSIRAKFKEDESEGRMFQIPLLDACKRWPGDRLRIAALGAIEKTPPETPLKDKDYRVLHDGTHFVQVNNEIVIRDRLDAPSAGDASAVMVACKECRRAGHGVVFALACDVSQAHRRYVHREEDWGLLACRASDDDPANLWINRTGTFGVGSASIWWGRLIAALGRIPAYLSGQDWLFELIYADDLLSIACGPNMWLSLLITLTMWLLMGTPFSWKKFRGGLSLDWVGFNLDFAGFRLGISASRANWLCSYLKQALADNCVVLGEFSEALGRLGFASQVLTWCKPFLAPLFSWAAVARRRPSSGERLRLPLLVRLSLVYLEEQLTKGERMVSSSLPPEPLGEIFRTDAKCEDGKVVLAGWELGRTKLFSEARWFSLSLTEPQVPWLFRSGKSSWASTSAEMLASVAAIVLFGCGNCVSLSAGWTSIAAGTDNQATSHLAKKTSSTKLPLMLVLMQLAVLLSQRRLYLDLRWRPRELNVEADALTNEDFSGVDMRKRIPTTWELLSSRLELLLRLLKLQQEFSTSMELLKSSPVVAGGRPHKKAKTSKSVWG